MTTLTMQDEKRLDVIQRVYRGELTVVQAALVMGVSERQCYWIKARVGKAGAREWFTAIGDGDVNARPGRRSCGDDGLLNEQFLTARRFGRGLRREALQL